MKLEKWALIAEIVSSAAIVVTLIFLTLEVRANSDLTERQILLDRNDRGSRTILESRDLAELMARIADIDGASPSKRPIMDRYGFDSVEAEQVVRFYRQQWSGYQADFQFGRADYLQGLLPLILRFPDQRMFWDYEFGLQNSEFAQFVNEEIIPTLDQATE